MIAPLLKKYAEEHNVSFIEKDIKNANPDEIEGATQLPIIYFGDERVEFDDAFARIS